MNNAVSISRDCQEKQTKNIKAKGVKKSFVKRIKHFSFFDKFAKLNTLNYLFLLPAIYRMGKLGINKNNKQHLSNKLNFA